MTQLEKYREEIIEVDKQIAKFLEKRFEIVTKIGDYKREKNLPIQDLKRDEVVMKNAIDSLENNTYRKEVEKVFQNIILTSKSIQY
ncbi:chorismate mutase [[Eubacterium] yurii]|jgi:hypothetical protein|nr:MAG: chorismate mutase [Lachnospiraceae bacterium]SKC36249.1 chorismate mutase [[Eubacterium] yurii]